MVLVNQKYNPRWGEGIRDMPLTPEEKEQRKANKATVEAERELIRSTYGLDPFKRLDRDTARTTIGEVTREEVRSIIDTFYRLQDNRTRTGNQRSALERAGKRRSVIDWFYAYFEATEKNIEIVLDEYVKTQALGRWVTSIHGISKILAAGLLAQIDITKAPTVGAIWRFAGIDPSIIRLSRDDADTIVKENCKGKSPTQEEVAKIANDLNRRFESVWRQGTEQPKKNAKPGDAVSKTVGTVTKKSLAAGLARRPYNDDLKKLMWKIAEQVCSFHAKSEKSFYGPLYFQRLAYETKKNEAGDYADIAAAKLNKVGKATKSYAAYKEGKLGEAEINNRARRWTVKLFLAHYHHVAYNLEFGKNPPNPYAFAILGHSKIIGPPNWPMSEDE